MESIKWIIMSGILWLSFLSCRHTTPAASKPCTLFFTKTISFSANIQPVFDKYCTTGCHAGPGTSGSSLNLLSGNAYSRLFAKKDIDTLNPGNSLLYLQMSSTGTPMPPSGKLDDCTLELILKWIQQGAKDN